MRLVIPRAGDTRAPTAALGACIAPKPLLDIVAGPAIGRGQHHACNGRQRGAIAEAIKPRARQGDPALAGIAGERFRGDRPVGAGRDLVLETAQRWCARLRLWLTARGDTDVESDFHGCPPEEAMAQASSLR